ncbi:MAG: radical SAM protein [Chitinivibrionales bacterium]|nr:radical SAM protein [Chitinivibrionales bacterium]
MKMQKKFYMWQNRMCITYLLHFNQMKRFLELNGWVEVNDYQYADYAIVGACGAFLPDFRVFFDELAKLENAVADIIVYGCLPIIDAKRYKNSISREHLFIPARHPERIENVINDPIYYWKDVDLNGLFRVEDYVTYSPERRYILVQEGCNNHCYFCPHRLSIGKEKSRPLDDIVKQVRLGINEGATVYVLEGNNSGAWGMDLEPPNTFADLLYHILSEVGENEIYIGDFEPKWIKEYGESLIHPNIRDIKIPIQTTSARLLSLMGRDPYVKEMEWFLKKIKLMEPCAFLRTEIIIGFPTETKNELLETLEFVSKYFNKVSCFSFDVHPSTRIARMEIDLLPEDVIAEHIRIAMDFFKDKSINAAFDNRGKVVEQVTGNKACACRKVKAK